jgi:hypothetical protein
MSHEEWVRGDGWSAVWAGKRDAPVETGEDSGRDLHQGGADPANLRRGEGLRIARWKELQAEIDGAKQRDLEYLGFTLDWEHRFSDDAPLYMQVSRGALVLHLSEHHGDGTPGSAVYVETSSVRAYQAELQAKDYRYLRPGVGVDEIGTCMTLLDPFGNTLRLNEPPPDAAGATR